MTQARYRLKPRDCQGGKILQSLPEIFPKTGGNFASSDTEDNVYACSLRQAILKSR